jgi:hypothetical protein
MEMGKRVITALVLVLGFAVAAMAQQQAGPLFGDPTAPWPRQVTSGGTTITIYQPQVDSWQWRDLVGRAAVSVKDAVSPQENFGVIWFTAKTFTHRFEGAVTLDHLTITKVNFPAAAGMTDQYLQILNASVPEHVSGISLARLEACVAVTKAESVQQKPVAVKNEPPKIYFSAGPAVLVHMDGEPVLRQVPGYAQMLRVINTYAGIFFNESTGIYYLHVAGKWAESRAIEGPWTVSKKPPASLNKILASLTKNKQVDALDTLSPYVTGEARKGIFPTIYVSTVPSELLMTYGDPSYELLDGTSLMDVSNTSDNIVVDPSTSYQYALISGRWFRTKALETGPWEYVANNELPPDFAKIPVTHPRGAVLASVTGTPQAQESLIDNGIPQTAEVNRQTTTLVIKYQESPQVKPIDGTPLYYVANSQYPVIKVDDWTWYALKSGVWFAGSSISGPWAVATSVPQVIYTIPASSPLHYVTYAYVYDYTPQTVVVGYTPGYLGTVVAPTGVVVYGTGYIYPPVYVGALWYPPPVTYGFGAGFFWGGVTGFAFGAAAGAIWGGAWGHWGGYYGHYGNINNVHINNFNSYNNWNRSEVNSSVRNRTSSMTPQQRQQAQRDTNRQTGNLSPQQRGNLQSRASTRPDNVFAGKDGSAYKRGSDGSWQQHGSSGWNKADFSGGRESASSLDREQQARSFGDWGEHMHGLFGGGGGGFGDRFGGGGWDRGGGFGGFHGGFGGGGFGGFHGGFGGFRR